MELAYEQTIHERTRNTLGLLVCKFRLFSGVLYVVRVLSARLQVPYALVYSVCIARSVCSCACSGCACVFWMFCVFCLLAYKFPMCVCRVFCLLVRMFRMCLCVSCMSCVFCSLVRKFRLCWCVLCVACSACSSASSVCARVFCGLRVLSARLQVPSVLVCSVGYVFSLLVGKFRNTCSCVRSARLCARVFCVRSARM